MPAGASRVPVVVLVHGSGATDMDETVGACKPFRDLAWGLAERGVAVVRYDKRTYVYPETIKNTTIDEETTDDAVSAIRLAGTLPEADPARVYVAGHSLGAMMAPRIAERARNVAGVVMLAAPARDMREIVREQAAFLLPSGADSAFIGSIVAETERKAPQYFSGTMAEYDRFATMRRLDIPFLILQGERDYQVRMADFNLWKSAVGRKKGVRMKSYPKLNHLFIEGGSGMSTPIEYSKPGKVADYVIDDIARFILEQPGKSGSAENSWGKESISASERP